MANPETTPVHDGRTLTWLVGFIALVAGVDLLREAGSVLLPLVAAAFLIAVAWPLQQRLERWMPRGAAALVTFLATVAVAAGFVFAVSEAAEPIAGELPAYMNEPERVVEELRSWAGEHGLPVPAEEGGTSAAAQWVVSSLARNTASLAGGLVLVLAFFVLGLLEVHDFRGKLAAAAGGHRGWREATSVVVGGVQRYIAVRTFTGLLTGVGTGLVAWAIGLEYPVVWGVLNFLLNYIPTLGSIAGIIPPTLFALGEHGTGTALLALAGIGGVQLLMGNYVDPRLQGRYLALSPLVVLFSVAFWGWVWGVVGAFLGIPITLGLVTAAAEFDETRWIATLLAEGDGDEVAEGAGEEEEGATPRGSAPPPPQASAP